MLRGFLGEKLEMYSKEREKRTCQRGIMNEMVEATSPCGEEPKGDGNAGDCMVVAGSDPAWGFCSLGGL